jgi:hypothetical protein
MALFPETSRRRPQYGYDNTPDERVIRTPPEAGNSYIRDIWGVVRFVARMEFLLALTDAKVLWDWYLTNRLIAFEMYDFEETTFTAKNIGTGNGAILTFTVPMHMTTFPAVFVNGVAKTAGVDFNVSQLTGASTQDQIVFIAGHAPPNGQAVTITVDGRAFYSCEFAEPATRRTVGYNRVYIGMKVRQRFPL